jgi:2,5-diamino-6-(ribosylamino)-4(3H)-pyrimidinone 5'-phosphate reductase
MKPYVICHMSASVDGRIKTRDWNLSAEGRSEYERTAATYRADAWMCGRITMEGYARGEKLGQTPATEIIPKLDFMASHTSSSYAIAIDPSGKLQWQTNAIDGDHVIAVLTERVSNSYLAFLQDKNISYIFGGKTELDLNVVLEKLATEFKIKTLLLEGGGKINGSMLAAGLIDEISLLLAPVADGGMEAPTLFDIDRSIPQRHAAKLKLLAVEQRADDILWLRYKVHAE